MVCLTVQKANDSDAPRKIDDKEQIAAFLMRYGMIFEHWGVRCGEESGQEAILFQYKDEIESLKKRGGYITADVIDVDRQTPGLEAMLEKFKKEHIHDEDEVRFIVKGSGIFHIHADDGTVFAVEMHPGDLITVPRGTKHWFNLCADKTIQAIRLFQDPGGWTPHYIDPEIHEQFEPVCFGPAYMADRRIDSIVKP